MKYLNINLSHIVFYCKENIYLFFKVISLNIIKIKNVYNKCDNEKKIILLIFYDFRKIIMIWVSNLIKI